jgi:hypothetical protein
MTQAVLLSNKRTGSTFCQEALNSHPQMIALDEMFMVSTKLKKRRGYDLYKTKKDQYDMSISQYLNWIATKNRNTIFRLIYNQDQHWNVLKHIADRKMPVIHLVRDPIDIVVSLMCKFAHIKPEDTVVVDVNNFVSLVHKHTKLKYDYKDNLSSRGIVTYDIDYKNMMGKKEGRMEGIELVGSFNIRSRQITYVDETINKDICKFLNIDNIPMYSNVTKKFTMPREEKISNWNEVEKALIDENFILNR